MRRRRLLLGVLILAGVAAFFGARQYLTLEMIAGYELQLRAIVANHPWQSFGVGLVVYALLSLVPGTAGKSIVAGWIFGFWPALVQVNVGLTIAALAGFLMSRYFLQHAIRSRFGFFLTKFDTALVRNGGSYVATMRLLHAPYTLVNYSMGASSIKWTTFWWSSQLGMLPGNAVFVLAGAQLPSLHDLQADGLHGIFTPELILAFLLMGCFPLLAKWIAKRLRGKWSAESAGADL